MTVNSPEHDCMCCLEPTAAATEDMCSECLELGCTFCEDCDDWHPTDDHY